MRKDISDYGNHRARALFHGDNLEKEQSNDDVFFSITMAWWEMRVWSNNGDETKKNNLRDVAVDKRKLSFVEANTT